MPFARPDITSAEVGAAAEAIRSGWLTTGPDAAAFETEFAAHVGGDVTAVAVSSATAGLHLALEALGIGPGDEVLVPTWTFTATAAVVHHLGADPVLVDVEPSTLTIDLEAARRLVTPRTKAVIPVHFAGLPVPRGALSELAREHDLRVVEDAAHAIPSSTEGRVVGGAVHDAAVFSFYATKSITTGEGGMITVADERLAERMRVTRLHGISRDVFDRYRDATPAWQYDVVAPGYKYNLPDPAAAMGRVQLRRSEGMATARARTASTYDEAFADLPVRLPAQAPAGSRHAWHLYVIRLTDDAPVGRDAFVQAMSALGVGTSVHFIPLHLQPYWRERCGLRADQLPVATREFDRAVSLPIFSAMSPRDVERVVDAVVTALS